jgi:iron-sulfur cluster repair protein YtfE (RIC family)
MAQEVLMIAKAIRSNPSVSELLEAHHRRLDDILERVEIALEVGNPGDARRQFALFRSDLEEHIRIEEELMFPSFDALMGPSRGPTAVMRAEHAAILANVDAIEEELADGQSPGDALFDLLTRLETHNGKEELVLYPTFERIAPPEAYAALAAEVNALSTGHQE